MEDYEKLGAFYLGRPYDLATKQPSAPLLLYDSKDLTTHAICVGMTGSGKTGLCLALIEEAAIDGIPTLAIDPKGDLGNLLLTFPNLAAEDFSPWVNPEDAAKKGLAVADFAKQQAETWTKGLAGWGQSGERIKRLRDAVDMAIYTPGSTAGIPISILKSFAAPEPALREDAELLRERISTAVTSLLGLVGITADPIQSREHILLSTILSGAWSKGENINLAGLIAAVQTPPFTKIGVLDLESFYPAKDRFGLVMGLNNLIASPGFAAWTEGVPLDIGELLYTKEGKPRVAIVSIAHLNDAERMFFVALLLNQVLGWVRSQSGTNSLRAILYMDEIYGYAPPSAVPPSKPPLLTLMKQARAFGLGVVLATQNPVDLDYKGLANAGTWFIGRLQAERDKLRLLDGLEGAAASSGTSFNRAEMDTMLSGLASRIFLMSNAHDDAPVVFESRWAMSYLRGPLTRAQIKTLMDPRKAAGAPAASAPTPTAPAATVSASATPTPAPTPAASKPAPGVGQRPALPAEVPQFFIPVSGAGEFTYRPMLVGAAKLNFTDAKAKVDALRDAIFLTSVTDEAVPVDWANAEEAGIVAAELEKQPASGASFADLPPAAAKAKSYVGWARDFQNWLFGSQTLSLLKNPTTGELSKPGEAEREFSARSQLSAREKRDAAVEALRKKYAPKLAALEERKRRAEQAVERERTQARQAQMQTAISVGAAILGAFAGRKMGTLSTVGRATTAVRGAGRSIKEQRDIGIAKDTVEAIDQQIAALGDEFNSESTKLESALTVQSEALETIVIKPKKTGITVQLVALAWAPYRRDAAGNAVPAWR